MIDAPTTTETTEASNGKAKRKRPFPNGFSMVDNGFLRRLPEFTAIECKVMLALALRADDDGTCFPSITTIQRDSGLSRSSVCKGLAGLRSKDVLEQTERGGGKGRPSSQYKLLTLATSPLGELVCEMNRTSPQIEPDQSITRTRTSPQNRLELYPMESDPVTTPNNQKPRRRKPPAVCEIPEGLATDSFKAAWERWLSYKRQTGKSLPLESQREQIKELAEWGEATAVTAIAISIKSRWARLFYPKEENSNGSHGRNGRTPGRGEQNPADVHDKPGDFGGGSPLP